MDTLWKARDEIEWKQEFLEPVQGGDSLLFFYLLDRVPWQITDTRQLDIMGTLCSTRLCLLHFSKWIP